MSESGELIRYLQSAFTKNIIQGDLIGVFGGFSSSFRAFIFNHDLSEIQPHNHAPRHTFDGYLNLKYDSYAYGGHYYPFSCTRSPTFHRL